MLRSRFALALAAALVAVGAVAYLAPRPDVPAWLAALAGAWPTLWFAAALVLAGTALAGGARARWRAAIGWTAVALATEAVQHPAVARLLFPAGPEILRLHPATYAHRGTFDPLDVLAALLGAVLGGVLAVALGRRGAPAPLGTAPRRAVGLAGRAGLLAVAVAATLATSPPPGPYVAVTIEPSVVCEGDAVRIAWTGYRGSADSAPERGTLNASPPDAFAPPLVERAVAVPGSLDVVAERSGGVAADPGPYGIHGGVPALVHARPCDATGRQYRHEDAHGVVALASAPGGVEVVVALRGDAAFDRLVRLDADADEVASTRATGTTAGRVRDVAVAPDGTVVAVGWRDSAEAGIAREAVVWRWPAGGDADAGTPVGPTLPTVYAEAAAVAIDATGRTWVAWTEGASASAVARVAAYAPDGALEAAHTVPPAGATEALALTLDALGRPTLVVRVAGDETTARGRYLHALDADGAPRWVHGPVGAATTAIASAAAGTTLVLVDDALHALDDETGAILWTTEFPEGRTATHLAVDDAGAAVVAGLGPFLQRYTADGAPASERSFGSAHVDEVSALAWSGGAVAAGSTGGPLATTLDPNGSLEAFVLRFPDGAP